MIGTIPSLPMILDRSLASDYLIRVTCDHSSSLENDNIQWELYPLSLDTNAATMRALSNADVELDDSDTPICTLNCCWSHEQDYELWPIEIIVKVDQMNEKKYGDVARELLCILARIIIQSAASEIISRSTNDGRRGVSGRTPLFITLPLIEGEGCQKFHLSDFIFGGNESGVRRLFASMEDAATTHYSEMELVDMVNQHGNVLGSLPRPYIHTYNILHRGIGILVTKDEDVFQTLNAGRVPLVYVHRRTSTKRIFPSLYDMFVGGVSMRGENPRLTAAREVAEELGLTRGLDILSERVGVEENDYSPVSDDLFRCTVCTSYNRCVVSMFTYVSCNLENITFQEEEVDWGKFVPYDIIELAAEASIKRLVRQGSWAGSLMDSENITISDEISNRKECNDELQWDFVPDGLLVWKAWKSFVNTR